MVGLEASGKYVEGAEPCSMCKRLIINAGIEEVVVRITDEEYKVFPVSEWVLHDESLMGESTY